MKRPYVLLTGLCCVCAIAAISLSQLLAAKSETAVAAASIPATVASETLSQVMAADSAAEIIAMQPEFADNVASEQEVVARQDFSADYLVFQPAEPPQAPESTEGSPSDRPVPSDAKDKGVSCAAEPTCCRPKNCCGILSRLRSRCWRVCR